MSTFLTLSQGIARAGELQYLLAQPIRQVGWLRPVSSKTCQSANAVLGWGKKENTKKAIRFALDKGLPYWCLEDGFISYLGHPALGDKRFALIVDKTGIYYDATQSSDLENLLNNPDWFCSELEQRSACLLKMICDHQVSKYNHEPISTTQHFFEADDVNRVLVVDQTYGDCSVKFGMADDSSFIAMLDAALVENPDSEIWVKVHPDVVLGTKKGYLGADLPRHPRLHILADKVNAQSLFPWFDKVYVVTSQLGFEALWHGKTVVCFGIPFYAGWGLTDDRIGCDRRRQTHTIESLFAAACLKYSRYIDPETDKHCELEDVLELIVLQRKYQHSQVKTLYAVGFSLWKRAFLREFIGGTAQSVKFVQSAKQAGSQAQPGDGILIWGAKNDGFVVAAGIRLLRCEDAFIRGAGLGADLKRPESLVIDGQGIYFDCRGPSDLENLINFEILSASQIERGASLRRRLIQQRISKYNLTGVQQGIFCSARSDQKCILVTGQVDSDASIQMGSPSVRTNRDLLRRVRDYAPDAFIVYKPHPDVVLAGRAGHIPEQEALQWADRVVVNGDIFDCISQCDELHVMTSLAGFEAVIQGKTVHTWGCPFYSSWGVTVDHCGCPRREARRTIEELVYLVYAHYPRYINWHTRRFTTPERVMAGVVKASESESVNRNRASRWFARKKRKAGYLLEAMRK